jgi:uroporphyrinogen decarboxylase
MNMTSRERFLTALNGKEPDMIPIFDYIYSRPLYKEVLGYIPEGYEAEAVMRCSAKIGYDCGVVPFGGQSGFQLGGSLRYKDEWGTTYEKSENTWPTDGPIDFPIKSLEDLRNYEWPDPDEDWRLDGIRTAVRIATENRMSVLGSVRGPFSAAWMLTGFSEFLIMFYENREVVDTVLTKVTDFFVRGAQRMAEAGVDAIQFADDYGSNTAPFFSPAQFREIILPHTRRLVKEINKTGVPAMMHSDGHIMPLLDDLVETGIFSCHPMERSAGMDIREIKSLYGDRLALVGNVNNKTTLVSGNEEDILNEVVDCISAAAPGGGYILASDHSLHDDIPNKNVFALYNAGRKHGEYPLKLPE